MVFFVLTQHNKPKLSTYKSNKFLDEFYFYKSRHVSKQNRMNLKY
jgi:hypothetical protein